MTEYYILTLLYMNNNIICWLPQKLISALFAMHLKLMSMGQIIGIPYFCQICISWFFAYLMILSLSSLNGTMPSTAELRDDVLIFKGPVTYDIAGTYVCDASNSIGTGSASVEVIVTGVLFKLLTRLKACGLTASVHMDMHVIFCLLH